MKAVKVYFDFKSPYTYLAKDELFKIEDEVGLSFDWLPWNFPVASGYGTLESRTPLQLNRVRYMYRDVRRMGTPRGLVIKPPTKIHDTTIVGIAALCAQRQGVFRSFANEVFDEFWRHEIDVEDQNEVGAILQACGGDAQAFVNFIPQGRNELRAIEQTLLAEGVFGIPTLVIDGELFWGSDRFDLAKAKILRQAASAKS